MREGIFVDTQIKQLFEDHDWNRKLNVTERKDWEAFDNFCRKFLDCELEENCSLIFQDMIS